MEENESAKLKALSDIASIEITLEFNNILEKILKITCETMNAHSGTIMLVDEITEQLEMVSSYGLPSDYIEKVYDVAENLDMPITTSPSGVVLETGRYYQVPNIFEESRDKPWAGLAKELGFSSQIFTPMKRGLKVIGLLNIYLAQVHDFTDEEINFMNIAASQAASVVQNARICSRLKNNINELKGYKEHLEAEIKGSYRELVESESRYKDLFENADDPMYTLDTEGRFKTINRMGIKILGATKEEIIGSHISRWLSSESFELSMEILKKQLSGEPWEKPAVVEVINKKCEHLWGEISTRVIKKDGRITGIHGIARDITEKRRLEQELKESEAKYRDLFENAEDPMFTVDKRGYFLALNNAGLKVLGCTKNELIGSHLSKWTTRESSIVAMDAMKKLFNGETVEPQTILEMICKNGEHRWIDVRSNILKEGNAIKGLHGVARDITEKMKLEHRLLEYHTKLERSYEELIEADRMKTEFVSNITHELLTPMTSIRGFAELLYDGTTGNVNSEQKKSLKIILRNSERLIRLIKDLLDAANLDKHKFGMKFELVSVNDIVSKSIQDLKPLAEEKYITIINNFEQVPRIWGDSERLTQVMTNLISNAIKFTPQNGTITVVTCENLKEVAVSVKDTGIGIPADKLLHIFDRFYQIDSSNSRKYGGIGLGLSICRNIIESHYGSIEAKSDGKGSSFHITLPKLVRKEKRGKQI